MNRTLTIIGIWIVGSGVVLGHVTNDRAEECGWPVRVSNDALIASLAWPVLAVAATIVDRESLAQQSCSEGGAQ